jgi:hypothetical protein
MTDLERLELVLRRALARLHDVATPREIVERIILELQDENIQLRKETST